MIPDSRDMAAWMGSAFGILIIVLALVLGYKVSDQIETNKGLVFLSTVVTPLALGFLILVASEIVKRLGSDSEDERDGANLASRRAPRRRGNQRAPEDRRLP